MQGTFDSLFYNADSYVVRATCMDSNFSSNAARIAFAWYQLIVVFLLPAVIMAYCYTFVIRVLWLSTKRLATLIQADRCANEPAGLLLFHDRPITPVHEILIRRISS